MIWNVKRKKDWRCCVLLYLGMGLLYVSLSWGLPAAANAQPSAGGGADDSVEEPLTEFADGVVDSVSSTLININGTEYYYSMDIHFTNMDEQEIDSGAISKGDSVRITFIPESNEALSVILESKKSEAVHPDDQRAGNERQNKKVIRLENGVYRN